MGDLDWRSSRRFIVRLDTPDGQSSDQRNTLGTGFFVAYGKVLTCAHVVYDAMAGGPLDKVLVVPDRSLRSQPVLARVVARTDPPTKSVLWPMPDLALLELEADLHHEVLRLSPQRRLSVDRRYQAWGYAPRADGETPEGASVSFRFEGHDGDGYLRLAAGQAAAGLSGSPLVDAARPDEVLGVIAASRDPHADLGGWAVPVSALEDPGLPRPQWTSAPEPKPLPKPLRDVLWENSQWDQDPPLPAPDSAPVPRAVVLRRSYRLGAAFARLGRMELLAQRYAAADQDSAERGRYIAKYYGVCVDACRFLTVVAPPGELTNEERDNATAVRIGHAERIAAQLQREQGERESAEFGARAAAALRLGLRAGIAPAMLPHLRPEQRAESARGLMALATELRLPQMLIDRVEALTAGADQEAVQTEAFALDDEVSRWFEEQARTGLWMRLSLCTFWRLAWRACLAALARSEHMAPGLAGGLMGRARGYGTWLGLPAANLPEITGVRPEDGAHAMHYLLHELPDPMVTVVKERYGEDACGLLWICTRLVGWLIFPDDGLRASIAAGTAKKCVSLGFPDDLHREVVSSLGSGQDFGAVKDAVWKFNQEVNGFYLEHTPQANLA
ncbi:trypsin-like peptidase domain-containing protein [Streptomyces liliifuscus]|uniref:Trypsin-like peptidase domain-containing protein n=1 Tax=Streptomyces liliifuscus TaxID=2797636 RepID=A0A7T7L355_9ACTN|nr:trypsin-like peptidase domain-containing protein [Streptomyces liliifuscus]QQM45529.1 trypsin-like peptidase domain-containing protein [Streptomyces liliifuscus]